MCEIQLSGENKILIDKSIFGRYWKYIFCVFIDFEYRFIARKLGFVFHYLGLSRVN